MGKRNREKVTPRDETNLSRIYRETKFLVSCGPTGGYGGEIRPEREISTLNLLFPSPELANGSQTLEPLPPCSMKFS